MAPSREFYPPEFTDRSRAVLDRVHQAVPDAVLIGGWATWVRTGGAMSHDIDVIVTRPQLETLTALAEDVSESRHLAGRKWRATLDGIHLDLYVPYESRLGRRLQLRTERLVQRQEHIGTWVVLDLPGHVATKLAALLDRPDSTPGGKDREELIALFAQEIDPVEAVDVIHDASTRRPAEIERLLTEGFGYLGDLSLDQSQRRRLRRIAAEWRAASQQRIGLSPSDPERDQSRGSREPPGIGLR
jgi:hypothetical protein